MMRQANDFDRDPKLPSVFTLNGEGYTSVELRALCAIKRFHPETPAWEKTIYAFIEDWLAPGNSVDVETSGSTGPPKLLTFDKSQMIAAARMTGRYFGLKQGDSILLCLPADYIAGKMVIVRALVLALDLIIVRPSRDPLESLPGRDLDFAAMVPLQVEAVLNREDGALGRIKTLIIGGAVVGDSLMQRLSCIDTKLFVTYGMTETLGHIALRRIGVDTSFEAMPGVDIARDSQGRLVATVAYLGINNLTSHDLIEMTGPNRFALLGRSDNVINSGGIKIHPEQVEQSIDGALAGRRFMVFGAPDHALGSRVELAIEGEPFDPVALAQLKNYLAINLPRYAVPKNIHFVAGFETTVSGKIVRKSSLANDAARVVPRIL
ncbi:MAG: AMP-binding protein [Gammaproteobacteria bacterium]